jgi:ATP-binding cassette, subfamily F, member 3
LGGRHALRKIGNLSGGERMRLCFAECLKDEPHLLLLDEATKHMDLETLDAMSSALDEFEGAVLMVSHNQGFLSGFCKELWVLENGHVSVSHSDTETFDEIFSKYRSRVVSGGESRSENRRTKAELAKRANKQKMGAGQTTALL